MTLVISPIDYSRIHSVTLLADLSGKNISANTDALGNDILVDFQGWIRIQVILSADAVLSVKINGSTGQLYSGATLVAGQLYEFDVTVTSGDKINIQLSASQTPVSLLRIFKIIA